MEYIHVALNNALCMDQILYRLSGVEYLKLSACENEYAIKFFIFVSINNMYLKTIYVYMCQNHIKQQSLLFLSHLYTYHLIAHYLSLEKAFYINQCAASDTQHISPAPPTITISL